MVVQKVLSSLCAFAHIQNISILQDSVVCYLLGTTFHMPLRQEPSLFPLFTRAHLGIPLFIQ